MQLDALHMPMDFRLPNRIVWYAEGFRWIGSLCEDVAVMLEREAPAASRADAMPHDEEAISATRTRLLSYL
jgi:hypothetical protein